MTEQKPVRTPWVGLFLMVLTGAAAATGVLYYFLVRQPMQQALQMNSQLMAQIVGSTQPVTNKLDARYADANNDGIADTPADPSRLIDPEKLVFSYVAVEEVDQMKVVFKDLMDALGKATGKAVEYAPYTSVDEQLKALRDGKLHITGLNAGAVPIAANLCGFVPVGMLAEADGRSKHQMKLIVPADSTIQGPGDLRGKELTLTEPNSNSGYRAAIVLLKNEFGLVTPIDYVIRNSGGHEQSIMGIAARNYQAAAVASDVLARNVAAGHIKTAQFRVIYTSEEFPNAAFGYAYNLKPEVAEKIKGELLAFNFRGTSLEGHFASSNQTRLIQLDYRKDWAFVRKIDDLLGRSYRLK